MADKTPTPSPAPATPAAAPSLLEQVLAQLVAGQAKLTEAVAALARKDAPEAVPYVRPEPTPLAPEHKGRKTYRLKAAHYRSGVLYDVGSLITVTDERPSKTWDLVTAESEAKAAIPVPIDISKAPRASDAEI